ncbi:hypothetical protein SDC9_91488 [bioreactor metagenome]|uniref:Uncharacterized protein n=1 Tax=bioreactor metagenome TaxID=1076179 RepID=A0A644ZVS7_9ZZZZ
MKLLFRFAGKADHERRTQHELRRVFGNVVQHAEDMLLISAPVHSPEHLVLGVLQRHIEVGNDLFASAEAVDELGSYGIGIGIEHAEPVQAVDCFELIQQFRQHGLAVSVDAVAGGILRNQRQFAYSAANQPLCFVHERFQWFADESAANQWNRAVGAAVVAAVRNAEVSAVAGGRQHPRGLRPADGRVGSRAEKAGELLVLTNTEQDVDFRHASLSSSR